MIKKTSIKIGNILKITRQKHNVLQEDIAKKLNKTVATISRWESGNRELNVTDLNNYLDALNLSDDERTKVAILITYIQNPKALKTFGFTDEEIDEALNI